MKGGRRRGCFLSPFLPAHIDSPRRREREGEKENIWADCRPHDILSGSLAFPPRRVMCSFPSRSLPLSLPSSALQSFDMSSPTTKTEVGRLAGATAASGCLALKLTANTAGRGGGVGGVKRQRKTEGGRERGRRRWRQKAKERERD